MIAADPPNRCASCNTTKPSCEAKHNYQHLPCCTSCSHDGGGPDEGLR